MVAVAKSKLKGKKVKQPKKTSRKGMRGGSLPHEHKSTDGITKQTQQDVEDAREWGKEMFPDLLENIERISRGGRPKAFETPKQLMEGAVAYFKWAKDNPWQKVDWKKDAITTALNEDGETTVESGHVYTPIGRPWTLVGLCNRLGITSSYLRVFRTQLTKDDINYAGFLTVIEWIEDTIRNQKFEGAAVNAFNANFIAYDLGMRKDGDINVTQNTALSFTVVENTHIEIVNKINARLMEIDDKEEDLVAQRLADRLQGTNIDTDEKISSE